MLKANTCFIRLEGSMGMCRMGLERGDKNVL